MNDSLSVVDDGYALFFEPLGMATYRSGSTTDQLTFEGAAEYFWGIFIEPLQR